MEANEARWTAEVAAVRAFGNIVVRAWSKSN
jgi:hypothetical protein